GLDLLCVPWIGQLLLWRGFPLLPQIPALLLIIILIVAGLAVSPSRGGSLAASFTWSLWWPALALLTLLGGRIWCLACPPAAVGDWVQRFAGLRRRLPRVLRNAWLQILAFLAITWAFTYWDIAMSARGTALFLLAFTLVAVAAALVFERRAFCRYLCPISGMLGLFGILSPLRLTARLGKAESRTRVSRPSGGRPEPCPLLEQPYQMDRNVHCHYCLACARWPRGAGFRLDLTWPGQTLISSQVRRTDEAAVILALYGVSLFQILVMFGFAEGWLQSFPRYTLAFLTTSVLFPFGAYALMCRLATPAGNPGDRGPWWLPDLAYVLVPLVWAMFLAHNLDHFVQQGGGVGESLRALWSGVPASGVTIIVVNARALFLAQLLVLLAGFIGSLAVSRRLWPPGGHAAGPRRLAVAPAGAAGLFILVLFYILSFPLSTQGMASAASGIRLPPIGFVSEVEGRGELAIIEADGSGLRRPLPGFPVEEAGWSPKGNGLVLASPATGNGDLYWVDPAGKGLRRLTEADAPDWAPLWSPDGRRIAYVSGIGAEAEIYLVNADGGGRRRLTENAVWDYPRSWSADGRRLLIETVPPGVRNIAIALLDVESGGMRYLTDGRFNDGDPAWSPDGGRIAFSSDRDGNREIYVMDAGGGRVRRLTDHPAWDGHPYWSPDGSRILFESNRGPGQTFEVLTMLANGRRLRRLTDNGMDDKHPSWSPDGASVIFESHRDGRMGLFLVRADGNGERNLTPGLSRAQHPSW
ncbi:MAG: PD40 domain-containing protein, partial [candidate division NC10 bacterium]|nr:PD40 domain-containing protein [candidate division NC10 bacterium]